MMGLNCSATRELACLHGRSNVEQTASETQGW